MAETPDGKTEPVSREQWAMPWCWCGAFDPKSARYGHSHLTWCGAARYVGTTPSPAPDLSALWQPIETAPKDGTPILLWAKDLRFPSEQCVAAWERVDIEWWHVTDGKFGPWPLRGPSPTHWMPLPAPPRAEGQQGEAGK